LRALRSGDNFLTLRVETKKAVTKIEGVFAYVWSIYETINYVAKTKTPGTAKGNVWQRPGRFPFRLEVAFGWHLRVIHKSEACILNQPHWGVIFHG
jgi:hypothetical protein